MNDKIKLHTEENLKEILILLIEVLENVIGKTPVKKDVINKLTIGFHDIKIKSPFNNLKKPEVLLLLNKIYKITKEVYKVDCKNWSNEEITSFNMISKLFE